MSENFNPIDFSKYAELRDLWNMHPSNTEGALYKGYRPAEGETAQVLRRYGELSQQLADELGGGDKAVEAMLALGAVNREDLDITSGATNYEEIMNRRKEFLAQGRSVEEADAIEPFRLAAILTGERQPDLNYVQADRARNYASQYGTPEQIEYTNQLATQLRPMQSQATSANYLQNNFQSAQPQAMMAPPSFSQPNSLAGQYIQPQQMMQQPNFSSSSMLSGQYMQPNLQNENFYLGNVNSNRQLSQLNLGPAPKKFFNI